MKWFKHFTDNHRGITIQTAFGQIGYQAYAVYIIMELCAEKLEKPSGREMAESDSEFTFNRVYFQNQLRMKRKQTDLVLTLFSELGWFGSSSDDFEIRIKFPMLLDLLDSDSKRTRPKRDSIALKSRLELDKELELDKDKEKEFQKNPAEPSKANAFVAAYCAKFKSRWLENPVITPKDAGIAKRISKTLSLEKFEIYLDAFFTMPDAWLIKIKHPLSAFETKLNEITVFATSGNFTTARQAHQADDMAANLLLLEKVRREAK